MKKQSKSTTINRREFFRDMAVLGGAALVAAAVRPGAAQTPSPAAKSETPPTGYHLTPHIRDYYDKAGF